ncbi:unnamed protein product [Heligmosomoides polygyrus]|uniref:Uncharacterized protein n=1 Tax=Heligmosomoides polygyrus TaxID=6339 RepID=A0A3P8EU43_HELPZ|nr:unnamed protein product [Heligmosomoides polygyrus]
MELGTTKPRRRKVDKQTWLWTDDVKAKVREKSLYHVFLGDRTADNCQKYQKAKKAAKKAVAVAKATHYGDVYRKLESRDACSKWRSLTGVFCDRKIPERLKSKIYKAVVRPIAT